MKYLGIDYGARWIGIAVSDENGSFAFPKAEIEHDEKAIAFLVRLIQAEKTEMIVFGDTKAENGRDNPITLEAERFMIELAQATAIPIETAREAWSSQEAARFAPAGERHNNASAAAIILQRFLDTNGVS